MEVWGGNDAAVRAVSMPSMDAWVYSRPMDESAAGGDVHYLSSCISGKITRLLIADVAGHGAGVADVSHRLRGHLRRFASEFDQRRLMERVNTEFSGVTGGDTFATALLATCYGPTGELEISSAGHPPPLWYNARARTWSVLELEPAAPKLRTGGRVQPEAVSPDNIPLGIFEKSTYGSLKTTLGRGDLLLFYTDGIIESKGGTGVMLGIQGLRSQVSQIPVVDAGAILARLMSSIGVWAGPEGITDDATMLLVRLSATSRTLNPLQVAVSLALRLLRRGAGA